MEHDSNKLPQEGTRHVGESLPEASASGCPMDSGEDKSCSVVCKSGRGVVGDQATSSVYATGRPEEEARPFRPSATLARTPPQQRRSLPNLAVLQTAKRKHDDGDEEEEGRLEYDWRRLLETTGELEKLIGTYVTTKMEVKRAVTDLGKIVRRLDSSLGGVSGVRSTFSKRGRTEAPPKPVVDAATQSPPVKTAAVAMQTDKQVLVKTVTRAPQTPARPAQQTPAPAAAVQTATGPKVVTKNQGKRRPEPLETRAVKANKGRMKSAATASTSRPTQEKPKEVNPQIDGEGFTLVKGKRRESGGGSPGKKKSSS